MRWKPNVTVAAVIEQDGRYLMVEEATNSGTVINQPAGHLEQGENLVDAVVRETLEETGRHFTPSGLSGIYRWHSPSNETTYLRFCFHGTCSHHEPERALDPPILRALWMSYAELQATGDRLRSPVVLRCIDDHRAGHRFPLTLLTELSAVKPT